VFDQVSAALRASRHVPALRFVSEYHARPAYIAALAASVRENSSGSGATGHLVMSFHGIPQRFVDAGDPYRQQCERTASLLARRLGLGEEDWSLSFQSRFGRARWLQPYTSELLDCLETLEEIGMENRDVFLAAGGETYRYIPALNARPDHVVALRELVTEADAGASVGAAACSG
jgi:ferrochelatase